MYDGFLNVYKPSGCTSRTVVNRIQRLVRPEKTGHAGTLDPLATGVLVVAIGQATRLIERVQASAKTYEGGFLLGRVSDTEDVQGEIQLLEDPRTPSESELAEACAAMVGVIEQTPPQYSALKVDGKRAYDLARRGKKANLKPRPVRIDQCELTHYDYPEFRLRVRCGGGTYIRSLGRDIGEAVGSGAVMQSLVRTAVGSFELESALAWDAVDAEWSERITPMGVAVADLPRVELSATQCQGLANGLKIPFDAVDWNLGAAFDPAGELAALVAPAREGGLRPVRNFPVRRA